MRMLSRATAALLLLTVLALAACGTPVTSSPAGAVRVPTVTPTPANVLVGADVQLGGASFVVDTVTLDAGQAVRFVDPATTGGPHMLCLGHNQICDLSASGPSALQGAGFRIQAGDPPRAIVFAAAGIYHITCSLHPLMNLTVTVR